MRYRFGPVELQLDERRLLVGGAATAIGPRAFSVLVVLAEHAGRLVTKDAFEGDDQARAQALGEEALVACRGSGHARGASDALNTLGHIARREAKPPRPLRCRSKA